MGDCNKSSLNNFITGKERQETNFAGKERQETNFANSAKIEHPCNTSFLLLIVSSILASLW